MGEVSDGLQAILSAIETQHRSIERLIVAQEKAAARAAPAADDDAGDDIDADEPTLIN
jgi:hypothetical protein